MRILIFLIWLISINCVFSQQFEYANSVFSFNQGLDNQGFAISPGRSNPIKALGQPEDNDNFNNFINFVSLGFGGEIILQTNPVIVQNSLSVLKVYETTWEFTACNTYPEKADVYVAQSLNDFRYLGETCLNDNTVFNISSSGLDTLNYIKFIDKSQVNKFSNFNFISDAYDLDGIEIFSLGPLPVELINLEFFVKNDGVLFKWITGSETNNNYFSLYVSKNLQDFNEIVRVPGIGNSSLPMYYQYFHSVKSKQVLYYKLTQTDFNGKITILKTVAVNLTNKKKVLKIINMSGQEIDPDKYKGIIIKIYEDGTFEKTINR
jgi:hypothetical protein